MPRENIARMKGREWRSIETEKAVSQLQEALGTIRVLQETLKIGRSPPRWILSRRTLQMMESQMAEFKGLMTKKQLRQKTKDLESECHVARGREGTGVGFPKLNAEQGTTRSFKAQVAVLKRRQGRGRWDGSW